MKKYFLLIVTLFMMVGLIACGQTEETSPQDLTNQIKGFSSYQEVKEYLSLKDNSYQSHFRDFDVTMDMVTPETEPEKGDTSNAVDDNSGHSKTNIQVDGVMEIDNIITDGNYIYLANYNVLKIIDVSTMTLIFEKTLENGFYKGLYLYNKHLVVLYDTYEAYINKQDDGIEPKPSFGYWWGNTLLKVDIYNLDKISEPSLIRQLSFDNASLSESRMIDGQMYLMMHSYRGRYPSEDDENIVPLYKDTLVHQEWIPLSYKDIYYFEDNEYPSTYLLISSFSIMDEEAIELKAYLGYGFEVYMNHKNLYISAKDYIFQEDSNELNYKTTIMRFELIDRLPVFKASTQIDGWTLNQYSFDEYKGVLRIATTSQSYSNNQTKITNQLFLLDSSDNDLSLISRLDGLGEPNERIYSVRMQGETAYVVTFRNVDPLYKIDLSNPEKPIILGEYKEEGVNDYLHIIGGDRMIGIGRQAENTPNGTIFTGVKVGLYDTSADLPVNMETILIEGEYSYSPVTYNPKLFVEYEWNESLLFAIPVHGYSESYQDYYQAIYLYQVNGLDQLVSLGSLMDQAQDDYYYSSIEKAIFIGNYIYTISYGQINQYDLGNDLLRVNTLVFNDLDMGNN